jgi:hypothetical protein
LPNAVERTASKTEQAGGARISPGACKSKPFSQLNVVLHRLEEKKKLDKVGGARISPDACKPKPFVSFLK